MKVYPSRRYHPEHGSKLVHSEHEDAALGIEWVESPADFGQELCPGKQPDPVIAARGEDYRARVAAAKAQAKPKRVKA